VILEIQVLQVMQVRKVRLETQVRQVMQVRRVILGTQDQLERRARLGTQDQQDRKANREQPQVAFCISIQQEAPMQEPPSQER
jgi:predicted transcriptional regulator